MVQKKIVLMLIALLTLSGCVSDVSNIDGNVTYCCADEKYKTFVVNSKDIPNFLVSTMMSNFERAMEDRGFQSTDENADLQIELRFEQDNLSQIRESDDFDERLGSGEGLRFIARVVVDIRSDNEDRVIWSGYIQRVHNVSPGEYMHTGKASNALLNSFAEILKSFPQKVDD
ncbi:MAG: hypothetical protein ACI9FB_001582 [Candidatus Azotimanducaceae bacterium]|jgi:hypothetical protein